VTPPPGLGTPASTPTRAVPPATTTTPSWGGWGAIPKVAEPFQISKDKEPKK
jgi:hypothetical protein